MRTKIAKYSNPGANGTWINEDDIIAKTDEKDKEGRVLYIPITWPQGGSVEVKPSHTEGRTYTTCAVILHAPEANLTPLAIEFIRCVNNNRTCSWFPLPPHKTIGGIYRIPINYRTTTARIGEHWWKVPYEVWRNCTLPNPMPGYDSGAFVLNMLGELFAQWCEKYEIEAEVAR